MGQNLFTISVSDAALSDGQARQSPETVMLTNTLLLYVTQEALSKARARLAARRDSRRRPARGRLLRRRKDATAATRH